jgi:cell division protein FtsL
MKQCTLLSTLLDLCQALYAIVGAYPKRILLFEKIQEHFKHENDSDEYKVLRLQSLCATRWTTTVEAVNVMFDKTVELRTTMEKLKEDPIISAAPKQGSEEF